LYTAEPSEYDEQTLVLQYTKIYNSFSLKGHPCETFIIAKYSVINNVQRNIVHFLNLLRQFSEGDFLVLIEINIDVIERNFGIISNFIATV
jgi:hypothetical protein